MSDLTCHPSHDALQVVLPKYLSLVVSSLDHLQFCFTTSDTASAVTLHGLFHTRAETARTYISTYMYFYNYEAIMVN